MSDNAKKLAEAVTKMCKGHGKSCTCSVHQLITLVLAEPEMEAVEMWPLIPSGQWTIEPPAVRPMTRPISPVTFYRVRQGQAETPKPDQSAVGTKDEGMSEDIIPKLHSIADRGLFPETIAKAVVEIRRLRGMVKMHEEAAKVAAQSAGDRPTGFLGGNSMNAKELEAYKAGMQHANIFHALDMPPDVRIDREKLRGSNAILCKEIDELLPLGDRLSQLLNVLSWLDKTFPKPPAKRTPEVIAMELAIERSKGRAAYDDKLMCRLQAEFMTAMAERGGK